MQAALEYPAMRQYHAIPIPSIPAFRPHHSIIPHPFTIHICTQRVLRGHPLDENLPSPELRSCYVSQLLDAVARRKSL